MTKARPAPLGATSKRSVRVRQLQPKPDAAPNGAKRGLFDRGYKDFAPTELRRGIAKCSTSADEQAAVATQNFSELSRVAWRSPFAIPFCASCVFSRLLAFFSRSSSLPFFSQTH
jgi:hypothetical protein